ncbi:MAG: circadian clock KaiB family protein [Deltaproteobacteria bacterium]
MNEFRLYIVGKNKENEKAVRDIKNFLEKKLKGQYSLEVLDMLENPPQALEDNIIITPTILRISPPPSTRVVGDMKAKEVIFKLLLD